MLGQRISELLDRIGMEIYAPPYVAIGLGLVLIAFGRKLYWLLVGLAGFAAGYYLFWRYLDPGQGVVPLVVGAIAGLVCSLVVVAFQKAAVAAVGFLAGGLAMLHFGGSWDWGAGYWIWLAALAAGIAGALLARSLFELGLIVGTSVAGAALVAISLEVRPATETLLFVVLAAVGVLAQLSSGRKRKKD